MTAWLLFGIAFVPALALTPGEDLARVRRDIQSAFDREIALRKAADAFDPRWGAAFKQGLRQETPAENPLSYGHYDLREFLYREWKHQLFATAVRNRDYAVINLDEWDLKKHFNQFMDGLTADYRSAVSARHEQEHLAKLRDSILSRAPLSSEVIWEVERASALMGQGRRAEAGALLKALGPDGDFWPPAILLRALVRFAEADYTVSWEDWTALFEVLKARDKEGRFRELAFEMLCLAEQSRSEDWKLAHPHGGATEAQWDAFMRVLGLGLGGAELEQLKEYLKTHPTAAAAAVKAARSHPACGHVRVSPDGSAQARTIEEGFLLLAPYGGKGVLLLEPGIYRESVTLSGRRVVLRSRKRGEAVIDPPLGEPALELNGSSGVVIDGLTLRGRGAHAVLVRSSTAVTIKNCVLEIDPSHGVSHDGSTDVSFVDCKAVQLH